MRRIYYLLPFLFFFSLLLVGCEPRQAKKELVVMWRGDVYNAPFARKLIDAYSAANPDVPIRLLAVESGYIEKMITMAAGNALPDVMMMLEYELKNMGSKGALLPLDRYVAAPDFASTRDAFWPGLLESARYGGNLIGLPIWIWTPGIYYNKDIFDAAGVDYPSRHWTWEEFSDKAIRLTRKEGGRITLYGISNLGFAFDNAMFLAYLYSHGGNLYSDDGQRSEIASPQSLAALKQFFDLKMKYGVSPTATEYAGMEKKGVLGTIFESGNAAMNYAGRDFLDLLKKGSPYMRWGVAPMPEGTQKPFFTLSAYVAVSAKTRYPDDAWSFISFLACEEGQRLIIKHRSDIPAIKKMAYENDFLNYQGLPEVNAMFRDMLLDARPRPSIPMDEEWERYAEMQFELVEFKKLSLEEACANIAMAFERMVAGAKK